VRCEFTLGGVHQTPHQKRLFGVGPEFEVFAKMVDGLDRILDVFETNDAGLEVRLRRVLLAAPVR